MPALPSKKANLKLQSHNIFSPTSTVIDARYLCGASRRKFVLSIAINESN